MRTTKDIDEGFNKIKPWLSRKLRERNLSVDRFSIATESVIEPTAIRRWYSDTCRPYARSMKIVCETLSRIPVIGKNGSVWLEYVPWSEGLAQYAPKPRAWEAHYINSPTPQKTKRIPRHL